MINAAAVPSGQATMRRKAGRSSCRQRLSLATALLASLGASSVVAQPYVGDVITVAFDFCPAGWLPFNGQLLPIGEHETLFQLIGTTYGGDGQETFALPLGHAVMTADRKALMQCIATYGVFPSPS